MMAKFAAKVVSSKMSTSCLVVALLRRSAVVGLLGYSGGV